MTKLKKLIPNFRSPAYVLVGETARRNWWLIGMNLITNLVSAVLEGSTLGVIYLAVGYLTGTDDPGTDTPTNPTIAQILAKILPLPPEQMFLILIFGAVVLQIGLSLSNYLNKVSTAYLSAKAQPYVTGKVFERIMTFSYGCVSRYKVGDLVLFTNDAAFAVDQNITQFNNLVVSVSFSLVYLVIIVGLSPILAGAATVLILAVAYVQYKLIPRLRRVVKRVTASQVESAKYITQSIQALRLLHTFGTQPQTLTGANQILGKIEKQLKKRALVFYLPEPILETLPMVALGILAASAVLFEGGKATILPLLLTFLLALQRLSGRLRATSNTITAFVDNSARMVRLETILDQRDKVFEHSGTEPFTRLREDIEFKSVSLSYTNDDNLALNNLTFTLPRHQVTALVGESGAGKSSIIDLFIGLYQPTAGHILVNGRPLADYCLEDWRQQIGVVSQDTFIFNDSILENLRYGRPSASLDEVVEAAKAAQAHKFILALPDRYETVVGERGYKLSGGQRQRLALARALIKQPEILILDEATSALDSESEKLIQQALEQFQKERTVIVVAHRLSTIAEADQILVLERGQLVEHGTHNSLLHQGERYARYWQLQSSQVAA
ncbi:MULTISPECIES: ABC transporter ATP-binding protein [unclassified Moorena]|uniref:ABC transporter ATP-binding protein n=1 Tax=unclassified Moorena TaxID=2683338 RepID=UPI0013C054AC|nr:MULTISPECIES: ABC transporter ATP-binding protein [unclassified Moorena]NEP31288.1 ABC transporter ATP-binding protein [Moorena sp. SIO3B2]NEQ12868.1 ABC transporter ATP-binding protein [Moorena sp. SIO3E2]NES40563.1 ABC transporter ATP-binding protein [Moorena sp. SIO2C4]